MIHTWKKLPVVVYIYGGAFIAGGKEVGAPLVSLYDGLPMVDESDGDMIYIVFNYRVGAFGFLGGTTMEKQGVPNVGLWDQRAVFQWVQDYIHLVGGDPKEVTAMGHSAGASSIMFHLTAEGGTLDPLFKYAIMQSPAYIPMWDREGEIEGRFQKFATLAGCDGLGLECLRSRTTESLQNANQEVALREVSGAYSFGPVPDGSYVRQLPMLEWAQGNIWPVEKVIMSHTSQETRLSVNTDISFQGWSFDYLASLLPPSDVEAGWVDTILKKYPFWYPNDEEKQAIQNGTDVAKERFQNELQRMQNIVLHSCFTCHMRWLIEALGEERVHLIYYSIYPYIHGADMLATFFNKDVLWGKVGVVTAHFADNVFKFRLINKFIPKYRSLFINFIMNKGSLWGWGQVEHPKLNQVVSGHDHTVGNVLTVALKDNLFFWHTDIGTMPQSKCDFWMDFYRKVSKSGNYTVSA